MLTNFMRIENALRLISPEVNGLQNLIEQNPYDTIMQIIDGRVSNLEMELLYCEKLSKKSLNELEENYRQLLGVFIRELEKIAKSMATGEREVVFQETAEEPTPAIAISNSANVAKEISTVPEQDEKQIEKTKKKFSVFIKTRKRIWIPIASVIMAVVIATTVLLCIFLGDSRKEISDDPNVLYDNLVEDGYKVYGGTPSEFNKLFEANYFSYNEFDLFFYGSKNGQNIFIFFFGSKAQAANANNVRMFYEVFNELTDAGYKLVEQGTIIYFGSKDAINAARD